MNNSPPTNPNISSLPNAYPQALPTTAGSSLDPRSYQELLSASKGHFVVCNFLIGTNHISTLSGYLINVGPNYFILRNPCNGVEITCDIYSLKFVCVYPEGEPNPKDYCLSRFYKPPMED